MRKIRGWVFQRYTATDDRWLGVSPIRPFSGGHVGPLTGVSARLGSCGLAVYNERWADWDPADSSVGENA